MGGNASLLGLQLGVVVLLAPLVGHLNAKPEGQTANHGDGRGDEEGGGEQLGVVSFNGSNGHLSGRGNEGVTKGKRKKKEIIEKKRKKKLIEN